MPNEYDDDDLDLDYEDPNDGFAKLRKANKQKTKQLKEYEAELEKYRKKERETTVVSVISSKGMNPAIAKFIPSDIDLSEESISKWLDENAEFFGGTSSQSNSQSNSSLPEGYKESYQKAQSTIDSGLSMDREKLIEAQIAEAAAKGGTDALKELFNQFKQEGL